MRTSCLASAEAYCSYYSAVQSAEGCDSLEAAAAMLGATLGHWPRRSTKSLAALGLGARSTMLGSACLAECWPFVVGWSLAAGAVGPWLGGWREMWTRLGRCLGLGSPFGRWSSRG